MNRHEATVAAPPARAYESALEVTLREMPIVRMLFTLRGIPFARHMTLRHFFSTPPFLILQEDPPREIVFGVAGDSPFGVAGGSPGNRPATPAEFRAYRQNGGMRAVGDFRVEARGRGSTLSTETWVETFGPRAARRFRVYWFVVGPFSSLVRHEFLQAARKRAEGSQARMGS